LIAQVSNPLPPPIERIFTMSTNTTSTGRSARQAAVRDRIARPAIEADQQASFRNQHPLIALLGVYLSFMAVIWVLVVSNSALPVVAVLAIALPMSAVMTVCERWAYRSIDCHL
jgi:Flp pilus assembly protein TadB